MNLALSNARPKEMSKEAWEQLWNNSSAQLQPLADVLKNMYRESEGIKQEELTSPNHYGIMVSKETRKQTLRQILALMPPTVDTKIELFKENSVSSSNEGK